MSTWLVTGGSGLLGANAAAFLKSRVNTVGVARSPVSRDFDIGLQLDIRDASAVRAAFESVRPNVVLHAAALSRHEECERHPTLAREVNVDATATIARESERVGARLVYVSTDAVFDGRQGDYIEADSTSPFSTYGLTKLQGEIEARRTVGSLVVRTNFFGWSPSGHRSILEFFLQALDSGTSVPGYQDFTVTSMYVSDMLRYLWELVELGCTDVIHLASSDARTKFEFGQMVALEFGYDPDLVVPAEVPAAGNIERGQRNISLNCRLVEGLLGRSVPSQEEGLHRAQGDFDLRKHLRARA